jgi:hypothetical protein
MPPRHPKAYVQHCPHRPLAHADAVHRGLPSRRHFFRRQLRSLAVSGGLMAAALGIGTVGYHALEAQSWIDAIFKASMILAGEGPVGDVGTTAGKMFVSAYALFSGVVFVSAAGVLIAPAAHRFLHRFHLEVVSPSEDEQPNG